MILLSVMLCFGVTVQAGVTEIKNSTSPDKKYYITVESTADDMDGSGTLQIRGRSDGKVITSCVWQQYSTVITSESATILWKENSRAVAITWAPDKAWATSVVFVLDAEKWTKLDLPPFYKIPPLVALFTNEFMAQMRYRGCYMVAGWLPNDVIKVDLEQEMDPYKQDGTENDLTCDYWVYLHLAMKNGPHLEAVKAQKKQSN